MLTLAPVVAVPKKVLFLEAPARAHPMVGSALQSGFGIPWLSIDSVPTSLGCAAISAAVARHLEGNVAVAVMCSGASSDLMRILGQAGHPVILQIDTGLLEPSRFGEISLRGALADLLDRLGVVPRAITPLVRAPRILLRGFRAEDRQAFADMNGDARVMEHFPSVLTRRDSDEMLARNARHFDTYGFGMWAIEAPGAAPFIGYVGLSVVGFAASFTPALEISFRLARNFWGHGYATEGAQALVAHAFDSLRVHEVVSFTVPANQRSCRVMLRIGMVRDHDADFDHPRVPEGHPLRRHVLFRISHPS